MRTRKSIVLLVYLLLLSVGLVGCRGDISQSSHNIKEGIKPNFIVGGDSVKKDSFKAVVALRIGESVCTGTLNSPTEISTAAHCFMGVQDVNDFSPSPKKIINTMIEEKEQELLDRGEHDRYEIKLLILDFLANSHGGTRHSRYQNLF